MRKNSVSPLKSALVIDTPGLASWIFLPAAMKSSQVLIDSGIDAGLLVEIAAVEHRDRAGIPWHGIGLVADFELGALEVGELRLDLGGIAERLQVDEAVRELAPEDSRPRNSRSIRCPAARAAGGAAGERLVEDLLVAEILDRDLDVRESAC